MDLSEYPCESLTFSGLGATGATPQQAAEALAEGLNTWVTTHVGQRILQLTPVSVPAESGAGLAALIAHTAGPDIPAELAEQVAAVVEEAIENPVEPVIDISVPVQGRAGL